MPNDVMVRLDDGVGLRTWTAGEPDAARLPVVMLHGGPGVPDYLAPVAGMVDDLCLVRRYDQRGTGGSPWEGPHTIERHVRDLVGLLDAWAHDRVVLVGHSYGTDLASFFLLAHPKRVAGMIYLSGPFLGSWRDAYHATERARRSAAEQARLTELERAPERTDTEEVEFLTLSWFTDHADRERAWGWAQESARTQRPVNYAMNADLNVDKKVEPLESRLDELQSLLPAGAVIIGGAEDSRPAATLRRVGRQLGCEVILIPDAGHDPWLEAPEEFRAALRSSVLGTR